MTFDIIFAVDFTKTKLFSRIIINMNCKAGEIKVAEHCRVAQSTTKGQKSQRDGIKDALERIVVPTLPPAKTKTDAISRAILVNINEMPDIVAACVQAMRARSHVENSKDVDLWYAKATSNINGRDYSKNAYIKRAVLRILLSFER